MNHIAYLSIGSNLGDTVLNCEKSIDLLDNSDKISVSEISGFYKTEPMDFLDQNFFVNLAVKINTSLKPDELLHVLQYLQEKMGQGEKEIRFGPRIIDYDIIFYDRLILSSDHLEIPHPRMHLRKFVLQPLCDIAPDFKHPESSSPLHVLLNEISDENQECIRIK